MEELFLVRQRTPATSDEDLDPVVRGLRCGLAQGLKQGRIKIDYTRNLVIKGRRGVGAGTVSLAGRTVVEPVAGVSAGGSSGARPAAGPLIWNTGWSRAAISGGSNVRRIGVGGQGCTTLLTVKAVTG